MTYEKPGIEKREQLEGQLKDLFPGKPGGGDRGGISRR